jgi:acyl-CoA thioester hydrolase
VKSAAKTHWLFINRLSKSVGTMTEQKHTRDHYFYFSSINTRWKDNDIYGHVNNVTYYSYFDSVANRYLIEEGGLDIHNGTVVGFVVASNCQYFAPIAYPEIIEVGLCVNRLGNSSVEYGLAIFKLGGTEPVAQGSFTHVFVDRASDKPVTIPANLREAMAAILLPQ